MAITIGVDATITLALGIACDKVIVKLLGAAGSEINSIEFPFKGNKQENYNLFGLLAAQPSGPYAIQVVTIGEFGEVADTPQPVFLDPVAVNVNRAAPTAMQATIAPTGGFSFDL